MKIFDKIKNMKKEKNMKAHPVENKNTVQFQLDEEAIKAAMKKQIMAELAEWDQKHYQELDALVLWVLHDEFGFGESRLKRFHERFSKSIDELIQRYVMDDSDDVWLCTRKLKEYGIDIEEWNKEREQNETAESEAETIGTAAESAEE